MVNEEEIIFNDGVDDNEFMQECYYQEDYCDFEFMMYQMKQDIYEQKTYGHIWDAADQLAVDIEGEDYSSWIF